LSVMYFNKGAI